MSADLVKIIPSILWFLLVLIIIWKFYRPIRDELLPNLIGFKAMGVELSFIKEFIDAAIELAEKSPQWKVEISTTDKERALNRAQRHLNIFRGTQILWVDDHPENNFNEIRMFRRLKVHIDIANCTEDAFEKLKNVHYDLVLSDIARDEESTAGLDFLKHFREIDKATPVIFYIGVTDPTKGTPVAAFGITNRPDELLHLTLDALERKRY